MIIEDGTGKGFKTKVDDTNRVYTRSVNVTELQEESNKGNAYVAFTDFINLTNTSESAILYLKNDEKQPVTIDRFLISSEASTGATTNHFVVKVYRNPTGLTSGSGSDLSILNQSFSSSNTLTNTSEKGLQGATVTGGVLYSELVYNPEDTRIIPTNIVLENGNSIAISITPPDGNSSFNVNLELDLHLETHNIF